MVDTIVRIGYAGEDHRKKMRLLSAGVYLLGTTITATLLGSILGFGGAWLLGKSILEQIGFQSSVAIGMLLYAAHEFGFINLPYPQLHRQVRREWLKVLHPPWSALIHGLGLGWGITTFIPFTSIYFAILGAAATANPTIGAGIIGLFGIGRGLPILVFSLKHPVGKEVDGIRNTLSNTRDLVAVLNGVALACGGTILGLQALRLIRYYF